VLEATQAEARGRKAESMEAITQDAAQARSDITTHEARIEGLDQAIKEIAEEIADVRAENVEFFRQTALARCEAFAQALAADEEARQARSAEYREMRGDLSRVRLDEKRAKEKGQREDVLLPEMPPADLGGASETRQARESLERFLRNQAEKTPSPRVIRSADAPKREPLIERLG